MDKIEAVEVGGDVFEFIGCNRSRTHISGALLADHGASWGQAVGPICSLWLRDGLQQGPPGDRILVAKAAVVDAEKGRFSAALWVIEVSAVCRHRCMDLPFSRGSLRMPVSLTQTEDWDTDSHRFSQIWM